VSDYICFLVTIYYESAKSLLECAMRVHNSILSFDDIEYWGESRDKIHSLLPAHVGSCGEIVKVQRIFEVCEHLEGGGVE
jgi:hypothetical protein